MLNSFCNSPQVRKYVIGKNKTVDYDTDSKHIILVNVL